MKFAKKLKKFLANDEETRLIEPATWELKVLPTGIDSFDVATAVGGLPEGRLIIYHGKEQSGKTTVAFHCLAAAQAVGGLAIYFDYEQKISLPWVASLGVVVDDLVIAVPTSIEAGFEFIDKAVERTRQESVDCPILVVWDSLHAAPARATLETAYEVKGYPPEARVYAHCMRRFASLGAQRRVTLIAISQVRAKIEQAPQGKSQWHPHGWEDRGKVAVGNAARFYTSLVAEFKSTKRQQQGQPGGNDVEVRFTKNQVGPKDGIARFPLMYGRGATPGVDYYAATWEAIRDLGLMRVSEKKGWWVVEAGGESYKVQSAAGFSQIARKHPEFYNAVRADIRAEIASRMAPVAEAQEEDARPPEEEGGGQEAV